MARHALLSIVGTALLLASICAVGCSTAPDRPATNAPAPSNANRAGGGATSTGTATVRRVSFATNDTQAVTIVGDLYVPATTPAPAVLALHQWQSNRESYTELATALRDAGFVVLAIDGRGFGESTAGEDGKVDPGWQTAGDIAAALDYLTAQPGVDARRIGIIGASYGASNAILYAADHPDVRAVALLSVGANYNDTLPVAPALSRYGDRPLLMMAARDDERSATDTERLAAADKFPRTRVEIFESGGHGTSLLRREVGGIPIVTSFFRETLMGTGDAPAPTNTNVGAPPAGGGTGTQG